MCCRYSPSQQLTHSPAETHLSGRHWCSFQCVSFVMVCGSNFPPWPKENQQTMFITLIFLCAHNLPPIGVYDMKEEQDDWTKEELQKEYVDKMIAITLPVNISIHGQQAVLNLSSAEELLRDAEVIAVEDCSCRARWHKCDAPLDVCLSIDDEAREAMKRGARRISLAQALVVLQRSHKAGLVHMAYWYKDKEKPEIICSCCSCCCHSLSALVRFGIPEAAVASEYIAKQNYDTCSSCGTCVQRCQFKARQLNSDNKLVFNPAKCFGCGLCVSTCPTKSITLAPRIAATHML